MGFATRKEDMSPEGFLQVYIDDKDGDIHVAVMNAKGRFADVEFCEIACGGGRSPKTLAALRALSDAIKEDNENCPEFAGHLND